jgi:hypothetical protein
MKRIFHDDTSEPWLNGVAFDAPPVCATGDDNASAGGTHEK